MSEATENISYYSVIPWPVLSSPSISDKTKLVYGLIASLAKKEGYCWARNEELAAIMCCGERTISRAIGDLVNAGELVVTEVGTSERLGNRERRIYTKETAVRSLDKIGRAANFGEASLDKSGEAVNRYDNKNTNIPPIIPPEGDGGGGKPVCKWKPERFLKFWEFYRTEFCAVDRRRAGERAKAAKAWDKLKPDDKTITRMGNKLLATMRTEQWQRGGIGVAYASTFLNDIARGNIDLDELPEAARSPQRRSEPVREEDTWIT